MLITWSLRSSPGFNVMRSETYRLLLQAVPMTSESFPFQWFQIALMKALLFSWNIDSILNTGELAGDMAEMVVVDSWSRDGAASFFLF